MREDENRKIAYQELCNSYRAIDTFRTALLGLLPLASGTGIFLLFRESKEIEAGALRFLRPIGLFGFAVSLGLFLFEIFGIRKCHELILTGRNLERYLGVVGQFRSRPRGVLGAINEPFASGVVYPAVLAGWAFVGMQSYCGRAGIKSWFVALAIFGVGFALSMYYNLWLAKNFRQREREGLYIHSRP